jgi:hypothetical protein
MIAVVEVPQTREGLDQFVSTVGDARAVITNADLAMARISEILDQVTEQIEKARHLETIVPRSEGDDSD